MPLLTCPNDNAPMQAVARQGVELDICPQCRGVWLDRGELEKLMARADEEARPQVAATHETRSSRAEPRYENDPQYRGDAYGERGERGGYDGSGPRRKKRFDVFDIFD